MLKKIGLRLGVIILLLIGWKLWQVGVEIYRSPAKAGTPISEVVRANFFSLSGRALTCKFHPGASLALVMAEHTSAVDAATTAYFEGREGVLKIADGKVELKIPPIDSAQANASHTNTNLKVFEQQQVRLIERAFGLGYSAGLLAFDSDQRKVGFFEWICFNGDYRLSRNLRALVLDEGDAETDLVFNRGAGGKLLPTALKFVSPDFSRGLALEIAYDKADFPREIRTHVGAFADGPESSAVVVDRITDCVLR